MMLCGVTAVGLLAAILQAFLLPSARAQSTSPDDGSTNTTSGNDYFSPGVYPARKNLSCSINYSNWCGDRPMGGRIC